MFDPAKLAQVKVLIADGAPGEINDPLQELSAMELRRLRDAVDALIPSPTLKELNLEYELVEQYTKTKALLDEVLTDEGTPANQKAQVCNAVVTALGHLVKLQDDLKKQEVLKIMEGCMIDAVKTLPEELKDKFYVDYGRLAERAGLA